MKNKLKVRIGSIIWPCIAIFFGAASVNFIILLAVLENEAFVSGLVLSAMHFIPSTIVSIVRLSHDLRSRSAGINIKEVSSKDIKESSSKTTNDYGSASHSYSDSYVHQTESQRETGDSNYGWTQHETKANYQLLRSFDDFIERNYPELPLESYEVPDELFDALENQIKSHSIPQIETIRAILYDMQKHLGIGNKAIIVTVNSAYCTNYIAGTHSSLPTFCEITLNYTPEYSAESVVTILAHEMSHEYQSCVGKYLYSNEKDKLEEFTDGLALYLGFSLIYKKGQHYANRTNRLGYLSDSNLFALDEIREERFIKNQYIREARNKQKEIEKLFNQRFANFDAQYNYAKYIVNSLLQHKTQELMVQHLSEMYINENYYNSVKKILAEALSVTIEDLEPVLRKVDKETEKMLQIGIDLQKYLES